ncbi:ATP-binding protein [Nocardioides sp. DS6]|uniref:histidine kinase n=1 Tax=Nocardioides eburneus TaxID=3231482 RepID=A0ABV3ST55_9ACTN
MRSLRSRVGRLPLRVRLVAGFAVAMLVVLIGAGAFVYWRVDFALDRGLDTELSQATTTLRPLVGADGRVERRTTADATGAAWQVLDESGSVRDHGGPAGADAMVGTRTLARAARSPQTVNIGDFLPASHKPYRLQITQARSAPRLFLLVGVRRDHRDEALRELLVQLSVAGLGALLVTSFVGDRLARAALRPVERYRRRAEDIAAGASGLRLDVPLRRDDEVTRLGHTLNDMLAALERALDRERQFVNEASHELRTPITLLTSRIQLARRRPRTQAEHERILEELDVDLGRLARLAEQLLDLGASHADDAGGPGRTADLAATVGRVIEQRRLADPGWAGETRVELPAEQARTAVSDGALERILTNLLDNARVHGTPPYAVRVDAPADGWTRLMVTDAGGGMPPALLATATRRFARADEARSRPGAGLGLALVWALVADADGELRLCFAGQHARSGATAPVACDHGPEMTVTVLLPAAPDDAG